ncbi:ABC transporter [Rhodopseudomonas palustris]|nr:ABC transporter [Rhodopseudomonas palustris]
MAGLDPAIHLASRIDGRVLVKRMDARVKSAHDGSVAISSR